MMVKILILPDQPNYHGIEQDLMLMQALKMELIEYIILMEQMVIGIRTVYLEFWVEVSMNWIGILLAISSGGSILQCVDQDHINMVDLPKKYSIKMDRLMF